MLTALQTELPITVFVYGTLKRGHGNHRLLEGAEFVGADAAPGVIFGGWVPHAKPCRRRPDAWIIGEVYRVTDPVMMRRLDGLEGHPLAYTRATVTLRSGERADIYYYHHDLYGRPKPIPSGEWTGGDDDRDA